MNISIPQEKQPLNNPLVVGGSVEEYRQKEVESKRIAILRKIFIFVNIFAWFFVFIYVIYSSFIKPVYKENERISMYIQPTIMSESDRDFAEKRYEEIYRNGDVEACDEFKNKVYRNSEEMGGGTSTFYYTCVYNTSMRLRDYDKCLSLQDDYSKRVCLHGLANVFKNPKYCQEAENYAQEEVVKEQYSQADSDRCYWNIKACSFIKKQGEKEGCLLYQAQEEGTLDNQLCGSFNDQKRKDDCIQILSVLENNLQYCKEAYDADFCYWSVVKKVAPNLEMENKIISEEWCEKIEDKILRKSCLIDD